MNENLKISIVVPTLNSEKTISKCMDSILSSSYRDYEVIIVDGGSSDKTLELLEGYEAKLIELKGAGAAKARNFGAKSADGNILLFLDSDVLIGRKGLEKVRDDFLNNPEVSAVIGIYDLQPANGGFFPTFDVLRKHYEWASPDIKYVNSFVTSNGAVKKDVFFDIGGFNESLPGVVANEDIEFGRRLSEKNKILLDKEFAVKHYAPGLKRSLRAYYKRSFHYVRIFLNKRRFENVKTTRSAAVSSLCAFFGTLLMLFSPLYPLGILLLGLHLLMNLPFYQFVFKMKGVLFSLASILAFYFFSLVVVAGVTTSIASLIPERCLNELLGPFLASPQ